MHEASSLANQQTASIRAHCRQHEASVSRNLQHLFGCRQKGTPLQNLYPIELVLRRVHCIDSEAHASSGQKSPPVTKQKSFHSELWISPNHPPLSVSTWRRIHFLLLFPILLEENDDKTTLTRNITERVRKVRRKFSFLFQFLLGFFRYLLEVRRYEG